MICRHQTELTALVDGELSTAARVALEAHLSGCDVCRRTERTLRKTQRRLQALPPPDFTPDVLAARRAVMNRLPAARRQGWRALFELRFALPAAAAGLLAVAVVALWPDPRSEADNAARVAMLDDVALARELELLEDYDLVGLERPEDLEVVAMLHELEAAQ